MCVCIHAKISAKLWRVFLFDSWDVLDSNTEKDQGKGADVSSADQAEIYWCESSAEHSSTESDEDEAIADATAITAVISEENAAESRTWIMRKELEQKMTDRKNKEEFLTVSWFDSEHDKKRLL